MFHAAEILGHTTTAVRSAIRRQHATGVSCPITRRLARAQHVGVGNSPVDLTQRHLATLER